MPDPLSFTDQSLTGEQREIQRLARDFARTEIAPYAAQWDRDAYFEPELVRKLGTLGFLGMMVPEQYDGMGLDTLTYVVALEEIAAADASVGVMMSLQNSIPTQLLLGFGNEAQKERYLRPMARGDMLGAFALSEPGAGSDATALTAQAIRDGDYWIVNGTKSWVTNGTVAGAILTQVRTDTPDDRKGSKGIGTFIVTRDLPGFHVSKKEDKMGLRASPTVQLVFEDMRVPHENLVGDPSRGITYALHSLDSGRLGIAAQAVGIARSALQHSVAYAAERRQFGKAIKDNQAIQFKLADMTTRITAARTLLHSAARAKDAGMRVTQMASMAKLFASETAMWVATQAVQIFG